MRYPRWLPVLLVLGSLWLPATRASAADSYQGLWWNPAESGWGVNFAHQGDVIFATWFTYDKARKPWWLIAVLSRTADGVYAGPVSTVAGPRFNSVPFGPAPIETEIGSMTATFADAGHATVAYTVNGVSQVKAVVPQQFGPMPTCVWGGEPNLALATNYQDLWWNPQESGWGVNFTHQGDIIFATWFTYDGEGKPWWLIAVLSKTAAGAYAGPVSSVSGPPFDAAPWSAVAETEIGSATATFADGNAATFAYTVNGMSQTKSITRQVFVAPGTVCRSSGASVAVALYAATDDAVAQAVLRQIFGSLGAGLYTVDGQQILAGAERGPGDFYLYDFESGLLARAYVARQMQSVASLAESLRNAGVLSAATGQPLTGGDLLALLAAGVQRSRSDESLYTLRLIDGLGAVRAKPLDLTQPGLDPATTYLDAMQAFLVGYDVLAGAAAKRAVQASVRPPGKAAPAAACDFQGDLQKRRKGGEIGGTLGGDLLKLHDSLMALGYRFNLQPRNPVAHWKHAESDGRAITFAATFGFYLGEARGAIACGRELRIPDEGPRAGVQANWYWKGSEDQGLWGYWPAMGSPGSGFVVTDAAGAAGARFDPFTETTTRIGGLIMEKQFDVSIVAIDRGVTSLETSTTVTVERHMPITVLLKKGAKIISQTQSAIWNFNDIAVTLGVLPGSMKSLANPGLVQGEGVQHYTMTDSTPPCLTTAEGSHHHSINATAVGPHYTSEGELVQDDVAFTDIVTDLGGTSTVTCPGVNETRPMSPEPQSTFEFTLRAGNGANLFIGDQSSYSSYTLLEQ